MDNRFDPTLETAPDSAILYDETISFAMVKALIWIMGLAVLVFIPLTAARVVSDWEAGNLSHFLPAGIVYLAVIVFLFNFRELKLTITDENLTIAYGKFRDVVPMNTVTACYRDTASALIRYGGWGVRFGRVDGRWRKVYNVIGYPNVVVRITGRRFSELVFSSRDPEKVIFLINRQIRGEVS